MEIRFSYLKYKKVIDTEILIKRKSRNENQKWKLSIDKKLKLINENEK